MCWRNELKLLECTAESENFWAKRSQPACRLTEVTSRHLSQSFPRLTSAQASLRRGASLKEQPVTRRLSEDKTEEWLASKKSWTQDVTSLWFWAGYMWICLERMICSKATLAVKRGLLLQFVLSIYSIHVNSPDAVLALVLPAGKLNCCQRGRRMWLSRSHSWLRVSPPKKQQQKHLLFPFFLWGSARRSSCTPSLQYKKNRWTIGRTMTTLETCSLQS